MSWLSTARFTHARGRTRYVVLIGDVAIKLPRLDLGWTTLLAGVLSNCYEAEMGKLRLEGVCPVLWSLPGGLCVVADRADAITEDEFADMDRETWRNRLSGLPVEWKAESFGRLSNGEVVAVDYAPYPLW